MYMENDNTQYLVEKHGWLIVSSQTFCQKHNFSFNLFYV